MSNVRVLLSAVLLLGAAQAQAGVLVYDSASADVERIRGEQREPLTASTDIKSGDALSPVSYTHLTLPTILRV